MNRNWMKLNEESGHICKRGDKAAEATDIKFNTPSAATDSPRTPSVIVYHYGVSCVFYRIKSHATTQTIDSLHYHLCSLQLTSNTVGIQTTRELSFFKFWQKKIRCFIMVMSLTVYSINIMKVYDKDLSNLFAIDNQIVLTLLRLR